MYFEDMSFLGRKRHQIDVQSVIGHDLQKARSSS